MVYNRYFVYVDDGDDDSAMKIAVPQVSVEAAMDYCEGAGDIVAVKDVSDEFHFDELRVAEALENGGFSEIEIRFLTRALQDIGMLD